MSSSNTMQCVGAPLGSCLQGRVKGVMDTENRVSPTLESLAQVNGHGFLLDVFDDGLVPPRAVALPIGYVCGKLCSGSTAVTTPISEPELAGGVAGYT